MEGLGLRLIATPPELPPGRTFKCDDCGATVREGCPHTALVPYPHQTYQALVRPATREELPA